MQSSRFLKIISILMLVFGAVGLITAGSNLLSTGDIIHDYAVLAEPLPISAGVLWTSAIWSFVSVLARIIAGIVGLKLGRRPERFAACLIWAVLPLILYLGQCIFTLITTPDLFSWISVLLGLAVPVLFLIAVLGNRNYLRQQLEDEIFLQESGHTL